MRNIVSIVLVALALSLFCALLSSPLSYALPLNCPPESRVIGIECFDANYNNTTPWYRRDLGATIATFPFWLVVSLVLVTFMGTRTWLSPASIPPPSTASAHPPRIPRNADRSWLPANCPHCGAGITTRTVEWLGSEEARCPYCSGVLKPAARSA